MKRNILAAVLILGGSLLLGNTVYEGLANAGETNTRTAPVRGMHEEHMEPSHMMDSRSRESHRNNVDMRNHMSSGSDHNDNCHNEI